MYSPGAQPNIKAYFYKTNKEISCASTSDNIFQNVVVLCETDVILFHPSLQDVKELNCLKKKILELGRDISDPKNNAIVDELCEEAAFVQERKDDLDEFTFYPTHSNSRYK